MPNQNRTVKMLGNLLFIAGLALLLPVAALAAEKLVDSSEYKEKDFKKGIITEYDKLVSGDDVNWVWVEPGKKLSQYKLKLGQVQNKSDKRSASMIEDVRRIFDDMLRDYTPAGDKGPLTLDLCIYEAENFSPGKAWIPFVGGHQMQAGIGIEVVVSDPDKKPVALFRHFAREGAQISDAAQEVAQDLLKYISQH